ncbi:MAG: DUF6489 family protein [Stagnimonas sp.]|nr:DUF6489 family protein [Stagnimonas sp.]
MQIKVEIDVKPEELRRFLGLPDVAGLQEDLMAFLKDKVGQASDGLSPAADFVRDNFENLKSSAAVQRLLSSVKVRVSEPEPAAPKKRKAKVAASKASKTTKKKPAA